MRPLLSITLLAGAVIFCNIVQLQGQQKRCPLVLELAVNENTFLPYKPIKFKLRIVNKSPFPVWVSLNDRWWKEAVILLRSAQNEKLRCAYSIDFVGDLPPTRYSSFVLQPGQNVTSPPVWLEEWEEEIEFEGDAYYVVRRNTFILGVQLNFMWGLVGNRHVHNCSTLTAKRIIHINKPRTQQEKDALTLLDYYYGRPTSRLTKEKTQTLIAYGIPLQDGNIGISFLQFCRILKDAARGTNYEAEATWLYALWLEEEEPEAAKVEYKRIIEKFPNTWWAHQAQQALKELQQSGK